MNGTRRTSTADAWRPSSVALARGSDLLRDLIERSAGTGEVADVARLHLELGDWYQWHARPRQAGEHYRQVVQLLEGQAQAGSRSTTLSEDHPPNQIVAESPSCSSYRSS